MKKLLFILVCFFLMNTVSAEVVIYDNVTTEQYKTLKIDDATNFKYVNEYPYVLYLNGSLYASFQKDEEILIPDNSEVVIYVPSPIKSDFSSSYDLGKSIWGMGFFLFLGFGVLGYVAIVAIRKAWKGR